MTAHMHEVVESCIVWQSRQHSVAHVTLRMLSSINTTCYSLHSPCFTGGALNLRAVLAGAVVAFLLLILLIAGIIVGVVLLRRGKCKERTLKKGHWIEEVECTEKSTELTGRGQESSAGHSEQWADEAAFHYEQHVADLHYESTDFDREGCCGREDGNAIRSERNQCDGVGAAENTPMKDELGNTIVPNGQQNDQPKGTPDAVYAVVNKSKQKKHKKTQGGASATTTQGADTEEQHYEWSSGFGQDWLGNVDQKLEVNRGDVGQGSLSNDAWETGPQSEPCTASAVYAVVDKSKKHKGEKTQGGASATTTQGVDTEEQHYECSSGFGQDWFGNAVGEELEEGDFAQGSRFNVAKKTTHGLNTATHVQRKKI